MIARTSLLRGPCKITFNAATFFSKGDVLLELGLGTFKVEVDAHGTVDERVIERVAKVRFVPSGEWENLTTLWPYGSTLIGESIFTGTDRPLVIQSIGSGSTTIVTFSAAAVTKMPQIILKSTDTMIGEVEFTCIGADAGAWTTTANLVAITAGAYSDITFSPAAIKTEPYTAAWGAGAVWGSTAPNGGFSTLDGVVIDFAVAMQPLTTDAEGMIDMMFTNLDATATCSPVGVTEQDVVTAMGLDGAGNFRGRSLQVNSLDLVITGQQTAANIITLKSAQMKMAPLHWGSTTPRAGAVQFVATRPFTTGVRGALFTVAP